MLKGISTTSLFAMLMLQLGPALSQQAFSSAPKLSAPDGSSIERLGDAMVINGRPVTIDRVVVSRPPADVIRHYRKALDEKSSGKIVEYRLKGDQIVARRVGEHFVTVRVQKAANDTAEVWIMTTPMQPPAGADALPTHLAVPAGSRILSNVETLDGSRRAHTVIATADAALSATEDFVKRHLSDRGFTLVTSNASRLDASQRVMLFQRGSEDVMVTIAEGPKGRTLVFNASSPK